MTRFSAMFLALSLLASCARAPAPSPRPETAKTPVVFAIDAAPPKAQRVTISVVGTNDLHGHMLAEGGKGGLALFAGYLANLRAARARDGGAVLLLDAGDAFQGTLESNLNEGAAVIKAFNALGYDGMAIGNHEFDFGPAGELSVPRAGEDPRGALEARAAEASFPFLGANVVDAQTRRPVDWPNVKPSIMKEVDGVTVGIIGLTTTDTPRTTMAANFAGLAIAPLAETAAAEARTLRERGADVVVIVAHAGGMCGKFDDPNNPAVCRQDQEIFEVARKLDDGLVDVIVAGHTHSGVAHNVGGESIIESFKHGASFGRVDLVVDTATGKIVDKIIHPPREIAPGEYEGKPIVADPRIDALLAPYVEAARQKRHEKLGVTLAGRVERAHGTESALGNLFTDLMLTARPADVAITNGGGLRTDLPAGELSYGTFFESTPFDNRFASVRMTGKDLRRIIAGNLQRSNGIFSVSGVRVIAACKGGKLEVELYRAPLEPSRGRPKTLGDDEKIVVMTSDFLATGGDGAFGVAKLTDEAVKVEDGPPIRDVMADVLRARGGTIDPKDLYDPEHRRITYPGSRPVSCRKD